MNKIMPASLGWGKKLFLLVPIILLVAASCNQIVQKNQDKDKPDQGQQLTSSGINSPQGNKTGWETFSNTQYGFTVQYPKNQFKLYTSYNQVKPLSFVPACDDNMVGCLFYSKDNQKDTNLEGAGVSVNFIKDSGTEANCYMARIGEKSVSQQVINGINFYTFEGGGAATGHFENYKKYRTFSNGKCLDVALRIASTNIGNYEPGTVKEFNEKEVWNKLDQVLSTFKLTSAAQAGPMPKMTYKVLASNCEQKSGTATIAIYADNKEVATFKTQFCDTNGVQFRAGNSQVVYFSVIPSGLGGYIPYPSVYSLYKLDLQKKTVVAVNFGENNGPQSIDFNPDLTKAAYVIYSDSLKGWRVVVEDLTSAAKQAYGAIPVKEFSHIGNIKFSPDQEKAAIAVAYGPDKEYGEIYVLDLTTKNYTLYTKLDSGHLQVNGWKNNNEVDWSKI